jgi:hypothetical protein
MMPRAFGDMMILNKAKNFFPVLTPRFNELTDLNFFKPQIENHSVKIHQNYQLIFKQDMPCPVNKSPHMKQFDYGLFSKPAEDIFKKNEILELN